MTDKLKELATAAARGKWTQPWSETISNDHAAYIAAASPDAILALISDLENERRKVTELVDGYEKDQAELKRLRTTIFTDNTQTVVNAEREIERLNALVMETATQYNKALQDTQADVERLTLEKKAAAMNYEAVIEGLKAQLITALGQEFEHEPENEPLVSLIGVSKATIAELEEMNEQLREQNIIVGKVCADLEAEVERLKAQEPVAYLCERDSGVFDVLSDKTCKKCFPVYRLASGAAQKE